MNYPHSHIQDLIRRRNNTAKRLEITNKAWERRNTNHINDQIESPLIVALLLVAMVASFVIITVLATAAL